MAIYILTRVGVVGGWDDDCLPGNLFKFIMAGRNNIKQRVGLTSFVFLFR